MSYCDFGSLCQCSLRMVHQLGTQPVCISKFRSESVPAMWQHETREIQGTAGTELRMKASEFKAPISPPFHLGHSPTRHSPT